MLSFIQNPEVVWDEAGTMSRVHRVHKKAVIEGPFASVDQTINERLADRKCIQGPRKKPGGGYIVSAEYLIADSGQIQLYLIQVSFNRGKTWIHLYDSAGPPVDREAPASYLSYYYLDPSELESEFLKYEELQTLRRLTQGGPDSLPDLDDGDNEQDLKQLREILSGIEEANRIDVG